MNRRLIPFFCFIALVIAAMISSCKDIIEPSISNRNEQLQAPADNYQSTSYTISFWWNEVDDALKYHLQVVSNTFASPGALVLDTLVTSTTFSTTFAPGQYQWRVRAENGSTQTAYATPRSFNVVFSSIKQQQVQLAGPASGLLTNQPSITFNWGSLYGATQYRLEIDTNNFTDENKVVYNQATPALQQKYTLSRDQTHQWRIRAENDTAQSRWSAVGAFTYDHTPPDQVKLSSPASKASVTLPVSLLWKASATAVKYKLYVYQSDSTTTYSSSFPLTLTATSYSFNLGNLGDQVYWQVSAIDAAGNESQLSERRSFNLQ